jgi:hypothetical protein
VIPLLFKITIFVSGVASQLVARDMMIVPEVFQFSIRTGGDFDEVKPGELVDRAGREKLDPCPLQIDLGRLPVIDDSTRTDSTFELIVTALNTETKTLVEIYRAKSLSEEGALVQRKWTGNEAGDVSQLMSDHQPTPEPEDPQPVDAVFFKAVGAACCVIQFCCIMIVFCFHAGTNWRRRSLCASQPRFHATLPTPRWVLHRRFWTLDVGIAVRYGRSLPPRTGTRGYARVQNDSPVGPPRARQNVTVPFPRAVLAKAALG